MATVPTVHTAQYTPVNTFVPAPMELIAQAAMVKDQKHTEGKQMAENLIDTYYSDFYGPEEEYYEGIRGSVEEDVKGLMAENNDYGSLEFREALKNIERKYAKDPIVRATPGNVQTYNQSLQEMRKHRAAGNVDYNLMDTKDYIQTYQKEGARGLQERYGSPAFNPPEIPKYADYRQELEEYVDDVKPDAMASTVYEGYFKDVSAESGIEAAKIASAYGIRLTPEGRVDPSSINAGNGALQKEAFLGSTAGENLVNNARKIARDHGIENPEEVQNIVDDLYASTIQSIVNERVFNRSEKGKSYDSGYFNSMLKMRELQQQKEQRKNEFMTTYGQYMGENENIPEQYTEAYDKLSNIKYDEDGNVKLPWWKHATNAVAGLMTETLPESIKAGATDPTSVGATFLTTASASQERRDAKSVEKMVNKSLKKHIPELESKFPQLKELGTDKDKADAFKGAMKKHSAPVHVDTMFKTLYKDGSGNPVYKDAMVKQASNYIKGFYGQDGIQIIDLESGKKETANSWEGVSEQVKQIKEEDLEKALSSENIGSMKLNTSDPNVPAVFVVKVGSKLIKVPAHNRVQSAYRDIHMLQQAMNNLQGGEFKSMSIPGIIYKVKPGLSVDEQNPSNSSFSPFALIGHIDPVTKEFVAIDRINISKRIQSINEKLRLQGDL